jgi:hypothetical protein
VRRRPERLSLLPMRASEVARWVRGLIGFAFVTLLGSSGETWADEPGAHWREFPFAQKLDMAIVDAVVGSAPAHLLAAIARHNVDIRLVKSAAPDRPLNPLLAAVPEASPDLLRRAEFRDTYEGRVALKGNPYCDVARDTVLIRDTASSYTLLHEFVQSQLRTIDECHDEDEIELHFAVDLRRMQVYQRRLYDDPFRLLDPQWRQDILDAQAAVADRLFRRIQLGQSQEAIVEKVLRQTIDERSPYYDATRQAQGQRYGELMIDNAIDLFNMIESSVGFVQETVRNLREEVRAGRIEPATPLRLADADALAVEQAGRGIATTLARVRAEILLLKAFYASDRGPGHGHGQGAHGLPQVGVGPVPRHASGVGEPPQLRPL